MNPETCSVEGCNQYKTVGDQHFCNHCRQTWRWYCILSGIDFLVDDINYEFVVGEHLKGFKKEGLNIGG